MASGLFVGAPTDDDMYLIEQMHIILQIGGSFNLIEQLIDLIVNHYTHGKKREERIEAKKRKVDALSGIPKGGIRCIQCPKCGEIRMHTHVTCPVCTKGENCSWLVVGCRDKGCHATQTEMKKQELNPLPAEVVNSWRCTGLDRHSEMEIRTSVPLDMINLLCMSGGSSLFTVDSRSTILLLLRHAIANKKSSYLTSANMALVLEQMGEKELFEVLSTYLKQQLSHDHENGCLNDYLLKCGTIGSVEQTLFGLACNDSFIYSLGAKATHGDDQVQYPSASIPPSMQQTRTPPARE